MNTGIISGSLTVLPAFVEKSGIRSFNLSSLGSLKSRFFAKGKDSLDHESTKSNAALKYPFRNIDMHLHDDRYVHLETVKATNLDGQGHNTSQDDVGGYRFPRDFLRTDDFDMASLENGRVNHSAAR